MENSPSKPSGSASSSASPVQDIASTAEVQKWMSSVEQLLNEIYTVTVDSKLNTEQKMRISNICRKIGHGTSQMAVLYQSLKRKVFQASDTIEALQEKSDLTEHLSEIKETIEKSCRNGKVSYADMIKKGPNDYIQPSNLSSVAIYPRDELKSSEETKNLVQKLFRPEDLKLQVRGVRKTKNGGVIVSTETKCDAEKLKQAVQKSVSGLTAGEPSKRRPRIVIVGVPSTLSENEVFRCIYEQNVADKITFLALESFLTLVKLSHKSGLKDGPTCNYILEVPAHIRKFLIAQTRLFINWTSCPVRDFTLVTRCFKCQQYGHAAKTCRETTSTCGHCGAVGHSNADCNKKHETPKCATCSRFKKPSDHRTGDTACPARNQAERRYINSIDYDGNYV